MQMFAVLIAPRLMSICGPGRYEPFWELTACCTLTLAFPHLRSAFHRLSCAQKTYFSDISIILPAWSPSSPTFSQNLQLLFPTSPIPSPSIHIQAFPVLKKKGRNPICHSRWCCKFFYKHLKGAYLCQLTSQLWSFCPHPVTALLSAMNVCFILNATSHF